MRIIYGIQCHKGFEQIKLLVKSLTLCQGDFVIFHIDRKSLELKSELEKEYKNNKNILFSFSINVNWSGFSQVQATLEILEIIKINNIVYDYFCLLSGEDCILKSTRELKNFLERQNKSFIDFREDRESYNWRINKYNLFREFKYNRNVFFRAISRISLFIQDVLGVYNKNFSSKNIYLGSSWFVLKRKHVDVICNTNIPCDIFKYTTCSDEHYFQMIIKENILSDEYEEQNLHFISFSNGQSSPDYLSVKDVELIKNGNVFFARKVNYETLKKLYEMI